ncbi:MAG: DUF4838 domain-containing protein [Verrucomicrobiaceae bacterium]|nr:DUF4838 domain-containing protein [Verrucomicrobiaceae bacterium]
MKSPPSSRRVPPLSILPLLVAILVQSPSPAADLIREGEARCVVVTAEVPSPAAKEGAKLLASQLERISGAKVAVVAETALEDLTVSEDGTVSARHGALEPETFLLVGESRLAARLGVSAEGLERGAMRLRTVGNALVLLGADAKTPADPHGSRHAVVTFLEEVAGMRYLWPGELGLVTPRHRTLALPALDRTFTPRITQRKVRWSRRNDRIDLGLAYLGLTPEDYDARFAAAIGKDAGLPSWTEWQRLGGSLGLSGGHSYGQAWEKYHEEHPEWFALQPNGSRDLSQLSPERSRLCKSNLALIEALARDKIAELKKSGARSLSLAPNDGGRATFCVCEDCRKLDPPKARRITLTDYTASPPRKYETAALTDRMVWFWNRLAERIEAEVPDTWFVVYAYSVYKSPPVREKLHPRLAVFFVGVSYESDEARAQARRDWSDWAAMSGKLVWRPNLLLYGRREGVPSVFIHKLAEDLCHFADNGLLGTDFDSIMHHWATEGLNTYALARLLWDPTRKADEILDDYCRSGFGPAAEAVKGFFLRIEAITNEVAAQGLPKLAPYTPSVCAELRERLDEAASLAGGDEVVARRIAFLRSGIQFAEIQARTHAFAAAAKERKPDEAARERFRADMESKFQLMRTLYRDEPLALSMPQIAWGSEGTFRKFGWNGAKSLPTDRWDADEEGRVVPPPDAPPEP